MRTSVGAAGRHVVAPLPEFASCSAAKAGRWKSNVIATHAERTRRDTRFQLLLGCMLEQTPRTGVKLGEWAGAPAYRPAKGGMDTGSEGWAAALHHACMYACMYVHTYLDTGEISRASSTTAKIREPVPFLLSCVAYGCRSQAAFSSFCSCVALIP